MINKKKQDYHKPELEKHENLNIVTKGVVISGPV